MNTPRYLLFDLDGTLINSIPDLANSLNLLRRELDCPPLSLAAAQAMVGDGVRLLVERALGPELFADAHVERFLAIYDQHLLDATCCYPGIIELLKQHDPQHLGVVTNKPYRQTLAILEGLGICSCFQAIVGGDSCARKKPDPLPLLRAMELLGAEPGQTVMIGDHHNDLNAGKLAGTATCYCCYGFGDDDNPASDYVARQSTDLIKLFPG